MSPTSVGPTPSARPPGVQHLLSGSIKFLFANSAFLLAGTTAALLWANLDYAGYQSLIHGKAAEGEHHLSFHFVVNDILMCFFFAMATKEIWESLLPGGALASPRKAATPLLATLGGVVVPAGLYAVGASFLPQDALMRGWAIPCATDIAFSYLAARLIFGAKHPAIPFLLLLAIADDAVGLVIVSVFYPTAEINLAVFILLVGAAIGLNLTLRRFRVRSFWAYLLVAGPLAWWGFYKGGIHPALALVPLIPTFPHESRDQGLFAESELSDTARPRDTLNEFEHWWKNPVELILMVFGFVNAGVLFSNIGAATGHVAAGPVECNTHSLSG
jgi:NhaA family Na+:H+ antiporter